MARGDALPEQSTTEEERQLWRVTRLWRPASEAPRNGTHILVCRGPYGPNWSFDQEPPCVVHWWGNPGEEGFYLSHGLVENSYNDAPIDFAHWLPLSGTEPWKDVARPEVSR
jgi:hypothetical protein